MQKLTTALLVQTLAVASNSGFAKAASAIGAEEARAKLAALVSMAEGSLRSHGCGCVNQTEAVS
jgi:hypothetical protein